MHANFVDDAVRTLRTATAGELTRVSEAAAVLAHADHLLVQVVRKARAARRSWSQIAAALETNTTIACQGAERAEPRWSPAPASRAGEDQAQQLVNSAAALVGQGVGLVATGQAPARAMVERALVDAVGHQALAAIAGGAPSPELPPDP